MATPTRSQGVSTPKNPLTSTPNRPTASPRPNTGTFHNRPFAYKSPAVKTPASAQGYSHRKSISSQPMSTPMTAPGGPALHDDLLNLNSPAAALMASMGTTGLTPLPSGHDGLGITTGITPLPVRNPAIPKIPEVERVERAQEVVQLLKTRAAGRGITRAGVEQVAQIEGFTTLWDDDNLTVAGNSVDLEIIFDSNDRDHVRDVILNLNNSDSEEPQLQREASNLLKAHLTDTVDDKVVGPWRSLNAFSADLQYLSQHDHSSTSVNCFGIVRGLYDTFRSIWEEEKRRMKDRHEAHHICEGNVGKPQMDIGKRLGPSTRYWLDRHEYLVATKSDENSKIDGSEPWIASFGCQRGEPSISSNQNWLGSSALTTSVTTEDVFQEGQVDKPNWQDQSGAIKADGAKKDAESNTMDIDEAIEDISKPSLVRFACKLEPAVLIPINVVTELNAQTNLIQIDEGKVITYQQALQSEVGPTSSDNSAELTDMRWSKSVAVIDRSGNSTRHKQTYMLFSQGGAWCLPTEQMTFTHPRHFADAVPVLRQYALLWTLLRTTVADETGQPKTTTSPTTATPSVKVAQTPQPTQVRNGVTKRSNKKITSAQLDDIMRGKQNMEGGLNIDISMDLVSNASNVILSVIVPIKQNGFIQIVIEVKRNGLVEIRSIQGSMSLPEDKLKQKATRILRLSEDIGVMVQWLLTQTPKTG